MDNEQKEALNEVVGELVAIKYELSLYMDDGLLELGENLENAIERLHQVLHPLEDKMMRLEMGAEFQNPSELTDGPQNLDVDFQDQSASQNETGLANTALPDKVNPRALAVLPAPDHGTVTEIINLPSNGNLQSFQAFFPAEGPTAKAYRGSLRSLSILRSVILHHGSRQE